MDYICHYDSPLGGITMCSDGQALTGLLFDDEKYFDETIGAQRGSRTNCGDSGIPAFAETLLPAFAETVRWLDVYFSGKDPGFLPPIALRTTPFRREVCEIMLTIPYGETITYGDIAKVIAKRRGIERMSAQAVGGAVGHNPISLIIPCHRVVGTNGSLTGYAGGIDKKIKLLKLEGADLTDLFVPASGTAL